LKDRKKKKEKKKEARALLGPFLFEPTPGEIKRRGGWRQPLALPRKRERQKGGAQGVSRAGERGNVPGRCFCGLVFERGKAVVFFFFERQGARFFAFSRWG
jgi:hypothetical protein